MESRKLPVARDEVTPALLRELLTYDPETGKLFWRARNLSHFDNPSRGRSWNTRHANKEAFTVGEQGYRRGMVFRRMYLAHIAAWAIIHSEWPDGQVDHINGVRDDNRLANLRVVSRSDNCRNAKRRSTNTSGVNGVAKQGKRWRAYIVEHLGLFDTIEEAAAARKEAEQRLGYHPNHGRVGNSNG